METIIAKKLTPGAFIKYGTFHDLLDDAASAAKSVLPPCGFFPDMVQLDFGIQMLPTISVCQALKTDKNIITFLEAHRFTCEGLLPIDGDVVIYVGVPQDDPASFSVKGIEAFIVPRGTFVKLNPLIIHGCQYSICSGDVHVVCMLPGRTFANDLLAHRIEKDEEKAEIIL